MLPFIKIEGNFIVYEVYENDSPMMMKIKEFMAFYGLMDIKMRMLKIQELKEIMGFPKDYVLIGTQADQKKFIGNALFLFPESKTTMAGLRLKVKIFQKKVDGFGLKQVMILL
ncbi:DNA cytosine methyltransferase [Chryseobacterium sp. Alg-005]|uniref:DNA cytosine methyltransferase n=1 Tax=Chryseobacterium sp. Alg-005 TaxID=3159516 RepID=UPI0036F4153F